MEYKGSVKIRAAPEKVMRALTEEKELIRWFPTTAKTDPKKGGRWEFTWEFDSTSQMGARVHMNDGEYSEVSNGKVSYTWWAGGEFSYSGSKVPRYKTKVEFSVKGQGNESEVTLVHSGFKNKEEYDDHKQGWDFFLQNLKSYLERGEDMRGQGGQIVK